MSHKFKFIVEVELTRTSGKFVDRQSMSDAIVAELDGANPSSLQVDDTDLEVSDWNITEESPGA